MNNKNQLGAVIIQLRKSRNISQAQLAELIGKSTGTIGQYERGEIYPSYEALSRIINYFGVDANIFFSREKVHYSTETLLIFNLFSQIKYEEQEIIVKFQHDLIRMLDFIRKENSINSREGEKYDNSNL